MSLIDNRLKPNIYQLRDRVDNRDFIILDIESVNGKTILKCLIGESPAKEPKIPFDLDKARFNEYAYRYHKGSYQVLRNFYNHDWSLEYSSSNEGYYCYPNICKNCGLSIHDFDPNTKDYLTCNEMKIKDIIV